MQTIRVEPIGVIRTPFTSLEDMPIQPGGGRDVLGELIIEPHYSEGLADLDGFSHLYLIYLFHRVADTKMSVIPFLDDKPRGVFATRAPVRPNHLGLSVVELVEVAGCRVKVKNLDVLDNTPLLDIKPYIEQFDGVAESRSGWMEAVREEVEEKRSDGRFVRK